MTPNAAAAPSPDAKRSDWSGTLFTAGLVLYFGVFYGLVYWKTGRLMGGEGFKGILAGTLGCGFAILLLSAALATAVEKLAAPLKARLQMAALCALGAGALFFGWYFAAQTLRQDPSTYYYGTATGQYQVTYTSGKTETKSGAELGGDKWDWDVGLYLSITLTSAAAALWGLLKRTR